MSNPPVIAIPCRHDTSAYYSGREINSQNNSYIRAVVAAGGAPFLIPMEVDEPKLQALYRLADGVLFTGGGDIDPAFYNQTPHPATAGIQRERDTVELTLARWAIADKKPLLGICRGFQVMTVASGGTLYQDIATQLPKAGRHDFLQKRGGFSRDHLAHEVILDADSRLAKLLGETSFLTNSLHHQALKTISDSFKVVGHAADGVPEAIELPDHPFCIGVQWHPEELVEKTEHAPKLFRAFIAASAQSAEQDNGK